MKLFSIPKIIVLLAWLLLQTPAFSQNAPENYPVDPASVEQAGVPKGEVLKFTFDRSKIFPGTTREYWVYIPQQYAPDKPACVYVNQDGIQWKAPTVFDNLIHRKEMPVTIGIFITPGRVAAPNAQTSLDRFNRSLEYDGLGDAYVRFLLEELLPEVEKQKATDGRPIRLSKNGNDRAIGGSSSGAVCAFTAAWERPQEFARVFSAISTYVGLRGADRYPTLIRKYEPKPLRVFLQDGTNDLNIYAGDWWKANETMERALTFAGYEVNHVWGEGQHNGKHGTALFPEAMRWLWKDWPQPVKPGATKNQVLSDILLPDAGWEVVGRGYASAAGLAANATGDVYYHDAPNAKIFKVGPDNKVTTLPRPAKKAGGTVFGPDGKRYVAAAGIKQILSYDAAGKETVVANTITGHNLVMAHNGNMYVTVPDDAKKASKIILIRPNSRPVEADAGLKYANGLTFTPDQSQLYVTETTSHWLWIYQVKPDGTLAYKQRYGWLHAPDTAENARAAGVTCDTDGRVYVASGLGVQVLDQAGRVNAIIPIPTGIASGVCFGGPDFNTLYVTANDKVYRRKLKVRGATTFAAPLKPAPPRL